MTVAASGWAYMSRTTTIGLNELSEFLKALAGERRDSDRAASAVGGVWRCAAHQRCFVLMFPRICAAHSGVRGGSRWRHSVGMAPRITGVTVVHHSVERGALTARAGPAAARSAVRRA